jgi:hypothetical protein
VPVVEANKSEILTGSLFFNENFSPKIEKKEVKEKIILQEVARTTFPVYQKKCVRTITARSSYSERSSHNSDVKIAQSSQCIYVECCCVFASN